MKALWRSLFIISVCASMASAIVVEDFEDWSGLGQAMPDPDNASNTVLAIAPGEDVEIALPGNVGVVTIDVYDFGESVADGSSAAGPRWAIEGVNPATSETQSVGAGIMYRPSLDGDVGYGMSRETSRTGTWFSPSYFGGPRKCTLETWNGSTDLNNGSGQWTTWTFEAKADGTASISAVLSGSNPTTKTTWYDGSTMAMGEMLKIWFSGGRTSGGVGPVASGTYAGKSLLVDNITFDGDVGVPDLMVGDADGNDKVDIYDFLILRSNYGNSPATWYDGDFNDDDIVNIYDFLLLRANYGKTRFDTTPAYEDNFDPGWVASEHDWRIAIWMQNGTQMSRDRCAENGLGQVVQTVLAGGPPYYGGSMQASVEFPYGRWVGRLKPSSVPGVLNSMFLKDWDDLTTPGDDSDGLGTEIDIELLTYTFGNNSGQVHIALHLPGATNYWYDDVVLDFNPSDDYHDWGFDIMPDKIVWHVDGRVIGSCDRPANHTFDLNFEMFFNSWTSVDWIHGPPASDAFYHIDSIKYYPYNE